MRLLLTIVLLVIASPAYAQLADSVPLHGDWIGTLDFRSDDEAHRRVGRLRMTLDLRDPSKIQGHWRTPGGSSGLLTGRLNDKGKIEVSMTFYGGASVTHTDGTVEHIAAERCQGESRMDVTLHDGVVLRLDTDRVRLDTPALREKDMNCQDMRQVVVTLQPLALIAR